MVRCYVRPRNGGTGRGSWLSKWPECCADLSREQLGLLPGGEVSALIHLVEVDDIGVRLLDPAARGPPDLSGNVVKPTGIETGVGACPAARAVSCPSSQYERAAEAPVPVSQYKVMLSRRLSRVRLPEGFPSTKARAIL